MGTPLGGCNREPEMSAPASETHTCRLWSCLEVGPAPAPCISYPRPQVTLWMEKQNKALLYSPGSYSQHPGMNHNEKNAKKDCVCTCITELLCCTVEISTANQLHFCCSITKSCPTLCDPVACSTPGLPVLHHLPELAQTHVRRVDGAIQPSRPLSSSSPPAFSLSQR